MAGPTIYDHPLYYDVLFGWDRTAEAAFYHRTFELNGIGGTEPILEVACGTGQISRRLARLGRNVAGMDISSDMLAFLGESAKAEGVTVSTIAADMTGFVSDVSFSAAFNPMSSFRLLHTDQQADVHLESMAASLRPGGVYVLDLDFRETIDGPAITTEESWEMERDGVTVLGTDEAVHVDDHGTKLKLQWGAEGHLRRYTVETFLDRVRAAPEFEVHSCHPESGRAGEDSASFFDPDSPLAEIVAGRSMVVLRRV